MKYGLIGNPLKHSVSPFIHRQLFKLNKTAAKYSLFEPAELDCASVTALSGLDGYNVTIPYKTGIIGHLSGLDASAREYRAVNTVKSGVGYNTDAYGFLKSIDRLGVGLSGRVLILGGGGSARVAVAETAKRGGEITLALRKNSLHKCAALKELALSHDPKAKISPADIEELDGSWDLLINCTPSGMYPSGGCPVKQSVINACGAVFDLIYNPQKTLLLRYAERAGVRALNGMYMLVCQAAQAQSIWYGASFEEAELDEVCQKASEYLEGRFPRQPVVFIGFMASGKTTAARAVAAGCGRAFIDIDDEIVNRYGGIQKIFDEKGEACFRQLEHGVFREYISTPSAIISTGGGLPMREDNLPFIKKAIIIYIDTPFEICYARLLTEGGRPLASKKSRSRLKELYESRAEVYGALADLRIDGALPLENKTADLISFLK